MSPSLTPILIYLAETARENDTGPVACVWCNNRINFIKHGTYRRFDFVDELAKIQRWLCKDDRCGRTFSIPPHPFLRISRFSLCVFNELLAMLDRAMSIAEIARRLRIGWAAARRAVEKAREVAEWLRLEARAAAPWSPSPCMDPGGRWSDFIRMFAAKFYPKRYGFFEQHNTNIA